MAEVRGECDSVTCSPCLSIYVSARGAPWEGGKGRGWKGGQGEGGGPAALCVKGRYLWHTLMSLAIRTCACRAGGVRKIYMSG